MRSEVEYPFYSGFNEFVGYFLCIISGDGDDTKLYIAIFQEFYFAGTLNFDVFNSFSNFSFVVIESGDYFEAVVVESGVSQQRVAYVSESYEGGLVDGVEF